MQKPEATAALQLPARRRVKRARRVQCWTPALRRCMRHASAAVKLLAMSADVGQAALVAAGALAGADAAAGRPSNGGALECTAGE